MKIINKINQFEELFVGYALLLLAGIATVQVFMRYVLNLSFDWVEEVSRYTVVLITFIGAGVCVRYGSHFAMDAVVEYVPNRAKHALKIISNLVSAIVMIVVFYYAWIQISRLHQYEVTSSALEMSMVIPYLPIGIFTFVIAIRFFIQCIKHIIGFSRDEPFGSHKKGGH
jgi:C4-dicarboxylate transporter, DctQ subunit